MQFSPRFWDGRTVLVTGHTGFKGSWLCSWLARMGARVVGFAQPPQQGCNLYHAVGLDAQIESIAGDIRDRATLGALLTRTQPEIVFHLAAQPIVFEGFAEPAATFETNVLGTVNLLDGVRRSPATRAVVVVTSDKCYRAPHAACLEDDPLGGDDPYSASKACAELVSHAYRQSYLNALHGVGVATARAGNVIGGGDFGAHRLVPDLIRGFVAGSPTALRHPLAVRPWQHVLDALSGYLLLAQALHDDPERYARGWNFGPGPGEDWTVADIAGAVARWFAQGEWYGAASPSDNEVAVLQVCPQRARDELGWRTLLPLDEAVAWTVVGYRGLVEAGSTSWLDRQIATYQDRLVACRAEAAPSREVQLEHDGDALARAG
jgi:CDP-glucose 4,6-dehydratase